MQNNTVNEPQRHELIALLEQNWLHARHVENERLIFTNIYAVIVAGMIGIISVKEELRNSFPLLYISIFIIFLSILGIVATYKLSAEFHNHINNISRIIKELNAENFMGLPLDRTAGGKWKIVRFTNAIYLLYFSVIIIFVMLSLKAQFFN